MDSQSRYDFYSSDALARESRLDRDVERSSVGRRRTVVTVIGKDVCPNDHDALKADPTLFAELEQLGSMPTYDEPNQPQRLLLANCNLCHTTLSRPVAK